MEKAEFLDRIASGLAKRGLKNDEILKYTDRVSSLLDELPEKDVRTILGGNVNIEEFVSGLLAERKNAVRTERSAPEANGGKNGGQPASASGSTVQERLQPPKQAVKEPPTTRQTAPAGVSAASRSTGAPRQMDPRPERKPASGRSRLAEKLAPKKSQPLVPPSLQGTAPAKKTEPAKETQKKTEVPLSAGEADKTRPLPEGRLREPGKKRTRITDTRDYSRFWLFFCLLSPLILLFCAALVFLFVGAVVFLALLTVALILLLVVIAAGGTALTLIGAIYGTTQLFGDATFAIDLYEIGVALIVVGGTLFLGILVYYAAVRLDPWLMKKVVLLAGRTFRQLRNLFFRVKGEMAR